MLWQMSVQVFVKIVASPVACEGGIKDTWREVANWAARQLLVIYGGEVKVKYYDLFDIDTPTLLPDSKLPVVIVNDKVVSSGGKISLPLIRKEIESLRENP